jgi:AcrR family transcriptional regulator|tara:strand:+ start:3711 stop:4304 length:594 start_codon:yes stop_codon:yes gene_type:complete
MVRTDTPNRKPGRPRSARIDQALETAVVDILAEEGYAGLRVDDVADRAGVSKTTIYRRSPTKAALVVDVLKRLKREQIPMPETGSTEADLRALVHDLYASLDGTSLGAAMAGLIAERHADPDLESALTVLWASRQSMVAAVIRRGLDAGELREGLDEATVLDLLAGPAYYRLLVTGQPLNRSAARRQADALIAAVLR